MTAPAFKEWHVIVEALGAGEQIVILRKGGLSEGHAGFQIEASRFWLFPTHFHAHSLKTKPEAARWFPRSRSSSEAPVGTGVPPTGSALLCYFAHVVHSAFLTDWAAVVRLDPHHFWTEATVRERFDWSKPAGLHALVVRVHTLATSLSLPLTSAMSGCKSWIDLPCDLDAYPSTPVLSDEIFAARSAALSL
jgi:hypothetical protein